MGYEPLAEYQEVGGVLTLVREYIYANGQLIASEGLVPSPVAPATFTDNPLIAGTTGIKAVHLTELRTAINAARVAAGLTAATWTDTVTADTTVIRPVHVTELRDALTAVYTALGVTPPTYTDATLPVDTALIKAAHLQELRAAHATIAAATVTMKAYYHLDAIGSVRALTSASGAVLERHDYTAFGEELTSPTGLDTRRFGGKERDPETGLAYFAARYYAPETGRFAQADAPGFGNVFDPQSLNQYGYTSGNPLRWVDPSGHQGQCVETSTNTCVVGKLPKPEVITVWELGWEWLSGRGERKRSFVDGDSLAEQLKEHDHIKWVTAQVCSGALGPAGDRDYRLSGLQGIPKFFRDYSTLATAGLTGNIVATYLGSYVLSYSSSNGAVNMTISNTSSIASALRPPVIGYTRAWQSSVGAAMDNALSSGPMSKTMQTFKLTIPCGSRQ